MRKLLLALAFALFAPLSVAQATTCYWVGGTGNWSDATHWASSSGGTASSCAAGSGKPINSGDVANFDALSGGGTATIDTTFTISIINQSGHTGTLSDTANNITL